MSNATTDTLRDDLAGFFWDYYKDVHNIRPRHIDVDRMSVEDLQREIAVLDEQAKVVFAAEAAREQAAIARTEAKIAELISIGAKDRATAIRWLAKGNDCVGDIEHLEWMLGVPFGYFNKGL